MKLKYKSIMFLSFIILGLIILPNFTKGSTDIAYTFDDNLLIDSAINDFDSTFNIRNSSYYTGHYNATYSFENDDIGSNPSGFSLIIEQEGTSITVVQSLDNHDNVLLFNDTSTNIAIGRITLNNTIPDTIFEFWLAKNSTSANTDFQLSFKELDVECITVKLEGDDFRYFTGSWISIKDNFLISNTFFHFRLDLDDSANTFDCYINNVLEGSDLSYRTNSIVGMDEIDIRTNGADLDYKGYIDGLGYTSDGYFESYGLENITFGGGASYTGVLTDSHLDDTNYFTLHSDGTPERIQAYFQFAQPPPPFDIFADGLSYDIYFSYDIVCPESKTIRLDTDSFGPFDSGTTVDVDRFYLTNVGWLALIMNEATPYTANVYYLKVELFISNNYTVGTNLLPYINYTGLKEVDRYEYALKSVNFLYPEFDNNPSGWSDIEGGNGIAYIHQGIPVDSNDRMVAFIVADAGDGAGLEKSNLGITGNLINITFAYYIWSETGTDHTFTFIAESSDTTQITLLQIDFDGFTLSYHNGSGYTELRNDLAIQEWYEFNLLLNYELDLCFLEYYVDGVYTESYIYPLTTTGKSGLNEIQFIALSSNNGHGSSSLLDYCGIYSNGISTTTDKGFAVYNTGQNWNTTINNLLYLKANGTFHTGIVQGSYIVGMSFTTFRGTRDYYNILDVVNGYDSGTYITNATFVFTVINFDITSDVHTNFNISTFKIDGVLLKEGINEYNLIFEHSGVDIDKSYFYVVNDIMYFNHVSDDTNLEYIQASFDINDVNSTDYSISYRSYIDNNAYGYMRINYTDDSNIIQLPFSLTTTRFILTQEKVIRSFVVLITDKDNDVITGLTSGYIYNIELLDVLNIQVSVITESLLNMMIPLIIILTPTLIFSKKFGKQVIVPFIILFSLVLTMTGVIPYWLFFIIVFPSLVIIFFKSRDDT